MKITDNRKVKRGWTVATSGIPIGTIFSGEIGAYSSEVYLRTYSGVVSLTNPHHTWSQLDGVMVKNYDELDVELVIH